MEIIEIYFRVKVELSQKKGRATPVVPTFVYKLWLLFSVGVLIDSLFGKLGQVFIRTLLFLKGRFQDPGDITVAKGLGYLGEAAIGGDLVMLSLLAGQDQRHVPG